MDKPWFGRKCFGWGWGLPQRWEGWAVFFAYLAAVGLFPILTNDPRIFAFFVLLATAIFLAIMRATSGKPQWGTWWEKKKKG